MPPVFSTSRGLFDQPFALELSTPDALNATIYYTRDDSPSTFDNPSSTVYQQPVDIAGTSIVRAASQRDDLLPSQVESHTFIFPVDVADQEEIND